MSTQPDPVDAAVKPKLTRAEKRAKEAHTKLLARRQKMLLMLLAGALLLNALIAYALYGSMVLDKERQRLEANTQELAQSTARTVNSYLNERQAEVASWANDPALLEALANQQGLAYLQALTVEREDILAARIFTSADLIINPEHVAPVRYAELDLLRRSLRRETTAPEAAIVDSGWQLHIAQPLGTEEDGPKASLLITYTSQPLTAHLAQQDTSLGQSVLQQRYKGGIAVELTRGGNGDAGKPYTASINNSGWQIVFTPSAQLVAQSDELPSLWITVVGLGVAASLALVLLLGKLLVRKDQREEPAEGLSLPQTYVDARPEDSKNKAATGSAPPPPHPLYGTEDILDIEVVEEDADILGLSHLPGQSASGSGANALALPDEIFRAYDIRGEYGSQLTAELAREIGLALGSEAQEQGDSSMFVARDARLHSPELAEQLIAGILASGCHVINIGVVPTPLMHFACCEFADSNSGVMVTASHNGAADNGFKMVISGNHLSDQAIIDLRSRISRRQYLAGQGQESTRSVIPEYIDRIFSDVALAGDITLVVDAANAVPGLVAPALFEELGCQVIPLFCDLDGSFPNHPPDPTVVANLQPLIAKVQEEGADLGVAFDGDGDRLMVVTPQGQIIWPDQLLMLFARDILARNPGADILFDVKCSKQLNKLISSYGGRPIMWKTGHSPMWQKMMETGALIGGEYSGHIFIKDRWYGFDDGLYTAARLLEIITLRDQPIDEIFAAFPMLPATPEIRVPMPEAEKFALIEQLIAKGNFQQGKLTTIDGLRVDFAKGWGLVRASNTAAEITLRFEAETPEMLEKIQQLFKRELLKINKTLSLEF